MDWVRIDNRLIHGQIIETWLPYTGVKTIVVANDQLAADIMQQQIMTLAIPGNIESIFVSVGALETAIETLNSDYLILFNNCADARRAYEQGVAFETLNIGNVHYSPGKRQLSPSVAVNEEDEACLRFFAKNGIDLDFRCVPNDTVQVKW
ncbi:PTS sugar transporter subunit IIB [Pseudodesulfovibrio senegalensis]|jgi:PTS system mannose-specific IIB component|uniref:PTS sugar transporter subunit IIB n=1 Tax=Pseudodesulfovibrio senegalensis TaxID=1721087 RepID=A0A6N6N689_9BACT|nr:PTS sugar transporter subunit IIB [Pseudodesulfovibrio senegalensis]KAB1443760.1 PTS sugar transporter subunit IIB [Pseudodesulfovibrio senegalensis]